MISSSIATYGGDALGEVVADLTHQHPQNSYGVAKVIGELLIQDYSRKGYIDGRAGNLAAVIIRDEANSAASGYASAIFRDPLAGKTYHCPVSPDMRIADRHRQLHPFFARIGLRRRRQTRHLAHH